MRRLLSSQPFLWVLTGFVVAFLGVLIIRPSVLAWMTTEEGPAEQASHVVLSGTLMLWLLAAGSVFRSPRVARPARAAAAGSAAYVAFLLMEEIHWGGIYGHSPVAMWLKATIGHDSIHALGTGLENPILEGNFLIALPLVAWFAIPLVPPLARRWSPRLVPTLPTRDEALSFFIVAVVYWAVDLVVAGILTLRAAPGIDPFEYIDTPSIFDSMVYLMLATVAWRVFREAAAAVPQGNTRSAAAPGTDFELAEETGAQERL